MTIGAAIIGLGFVGKAHLEALRRLGVSVRGVLGSSPERTRDAVHELKLDRGYESLGRTAPRFQRQRGARLHAE